MTLHVDIETYSNIDLLESGMYRYARDKSFELLIFAYAIDKAAPVVVDIAAGEKIPEDIVNALFDESVEKVAHNAIFERTCLSSYFGRPLPAKQWRCTMAQCARMGLPLSLQAASNKLKCGEAKDAEGKRLINIFCTPQKPTKANGMRLRITYADAPQMWQRFKEYCAQDVRTERAIDKSTMIGRACGDFENKAYALDARINDRGIMISRPFAESAARINGDIRERLITEARTITNLDNPMSPQQLITWLAGKGIKTYTVNAQRCEEIMKRCKDKDVLRVLEIRKQLGKISTSKYDSMLSVMCDDGRARGLFQYYGSRTGRWSGRLIQMHNLPKTMDNADVARGAIILGDVDDIELEFGSVTEALSGTIRTAFVAPKGKAFVICDYAAIEARILSWLADDKSRLDIFKNDGKIYEATAAALYNVDISEITENDIRRNVGKVAELALGYQGGVNALKAMGADKLNLSDNALRNIVEKWREENIRIVALWKNVEDAIRYCIRYGATVNICKNISSSIIDNALYIILPSKRYIAYPDIRLIDGKLIYTGEEATSRKRIDTELYGGKIVENIVQGIARGCIVEAMLTIDGYIGDVVAHIHDEVIVEVDDDRDVYAMNAIVDIFSKAPLWAPGLPLKGVAFTSKYYKKL